jgi:hypothetical protein
MNDPLISQTLRRSLAEWTDVDVASYYVAVALGVAPDPGDHWDFWGGKKWMFWSASPLGEGLHQVLVMLAESGVLEKDDEMRFRWNPKFDWSRYGDEQTKV